MEQNKFWLKFIISGKPQDYLTYVNNCNQQKISGGEVYANYNRWTCNKGNEHKG